MENHENPISTAPASPNDRGVDRLRTPFEPITLRRPMTRFGRALGLTPNVAAAPGSEILLCLVTGHVGEKAMLRDGLGDKDLRNLQNFLRGRCKNPTDDVMERLSAKFGIDAKDLRALVHGRRQGPLLPQFVEWFLVFEGVANACFRGFTARPVLCPCCNGNFMADTDAWWDRQCIRLGHPERRFVDRLLNAIVGASLLAAMLRDESAGFEAIPLISDPARHPIGNWLKRLQQQCGCTDLPQLYEQVPVGEGDVDYVSERQLEKYSCGEDRMPFRAGEQIIAGMPDPGAARMLLIAARTVAFVIDVVRAAAAESDVSRQTAQTIVHARLQTLREKIRTAVYAASGGRLVHVSGVGL